MNTDGDRAACPLPLRKFKTGRLDGHTDTTDPVMDTEEFPGIK